MEPRTLDTLAVAHEFAPGAGPAASERMASSLFSTVFTDEMGMILLGALAAVSLVATIFAIRRDGGARRRRDPALSGRAQVDLRALRMARMAGADQD